MKAGEEVLLLSAQKRAIDGKREENLLQVVSMENRNVLSRRHSDWSASGCHGSSVSGLQRGLSILASLDMVAASFSAMFRMMNFTNQFHCSCRGQ